MTARDTIARACFDPGHFVGLRQKSETLDQWRARAVEAALTAAGHRIVSTEGEVADGFEEALRLAEVGEYLYSECAYSYGDGRTEPLEWGIDWQWQQSQPDEYGQGRLLAEATKWHKQRLEDGTVTEATKLRAALASRPNGGA